MRNCRMEAPRWMLLLSYNTLKAYESPIIDLAAIESKIRVSYELIMLNTRFADGLVDSIVMM